MCRNARVEVGGGAAYGSFDEEVFAPEVAGLAVVDLGLEEDAREGVVGEDLGERRAHSGVGMPALLDELLERVAGAPVGHPQLTRLPHVLVASPLVLERIYWCGTLQEKKG